MTEMNFSADDMAAVNNDEKLQELILLISEQSQSDPKFGAVKLNKLLFYCDFSAYLKFGKPITGQEYFALPEGPAPKRLKPVIKPMLETAYLAYQEVPYYEQTQKRTIALRPPRLDIFSPREVALMYETIKKFWDKNATEISMDSHLFLGWKAAREREVIPYSTALVGHRTPTEKEREYGIALQPLAEKMLSARR